MRATVYYSLKCAVQSHPKKSGFHVLRQPWIHSVTLADWAQARFIGLLVFDSRSQAKGHDLETVQRSCYPI